VTCGARARILPGALLNNLAVIRSKAPGTRIMAAVKGNAYGHGLETVAGTLTDVDGFAVARLAEAESLRALGIRMPIVLLAGVLDAGELARAVRCDCQLVVHTRLQVELLEKASGFDTVAWLKIDTGMHRLGFASAEAAAMVTRLRHCSVVRKLNLMTHLAAADNNDDPMTARQFAGFHALTVGFDGDISIANSPAIFAWPEGSAGVSYWKNYGDVWVRPGIALYGISPFAGGCGADAGLQPVMRFSSTLIDTRRVREGDRVGYGNGWCAPRDTIIGIVAAGYGDGYTRFLPSGTPLLINGRRVPLAGIISMDLCAADLGPDARDRVGDPVLLWGDELPVEEIARAAGTIPYQLVTGVLHREAPLVAECLAVR